jgi:TRAP-type transport system periplasmic protein
MRSTHRLPAAIVAALLAAPAMAQDAKPVELKLQSTAPPGTPWGKGVETMMKIVDTESKGTLALKPGAYGSEQDTVLQLARGRIDMGTFGLNGAALLVPELSLLQLPFYFASNEEQDCVLDNSMTPVVAELLARKGVRFTGWNDAGAVHLMGKKPFVVPADLQGMKAGTFGTRAYAVFWPAMGASPRPLATTDVGSAFQTGLIDVAGNVTTVYVAAGIGKVAPVMTRVHLTPGPLLGMINQETWDRLTPLQREALDKARPVAAQARQTVRGFEAVLVERHRQAGGQFVDITPEQRAQWRAASAPLWPQIVKELGPDGEKFFARMEAGRLACQKGS